MDNDEHEVERPLSLSNSLFLDKSLVQVVLPTILEEGFKTQWKPDNHSTIQKEYEVDNNQLLASQVTNIPHITEPVSFTTADMSSTPHNNEEELTSIVSQSQTVINNSYNHSDDEESPITGSSEGPQLMKL